MSDTEVLDQVEVMLDTERGEPVRMGWLARSRGTLSFEYDPAWLAAADFILLDPLLGHYPGPQFPVGKRISFGMLEDSSPDRWGRMLMQRREDLRAREQNRRPRSLNAWDTLLGVYDETRMGALRLRHPETGTYLDDSHHPIPPLTELRTLEAAAWQLETALGDGDLDALEHWLRILIAPGSSLGGARPKCSFRMPDDALWIAKFPAQNDDRDVGLWEQVMMRLAQAAGVTTTDSELQHFDTLKPGHHTFCIRRFDRAANRRVPFVSAMNFTGKTDGEAASYVDIVQALDDHGTYTVKNDLAQLYRRLVFNILTSNRDDHLRNHGFFATPDGITLAPAYDLNPIPEKAEHALAIDETSPAPDIGVALETAGLYGLSGQRAGHILREVQDAVETWRDVAKTMGANRAELLSMEAAFST